LERKEKHKQFGKKVFIPIGGGEDRDGEKGAGGVGEGV